MRIPAKSVGFGLYFEEYKPETKRGCMISERYARLRRAVPGTSSVPEWARSSTPEACVPSSPEQRVGIYVHALPITFGIRDEGDREMQMIVSGSGISRVTDVGDRFALLRDPAFG